MSNTFREEREYLNSFFIGPVLGLAVIFYLLMTAAIGSNKVNYEFDHNIEIMDTFKDSASKADVSLVILGNSRLRNGVTFGFDPGKLADLPDDRKLAVIQYAENAGIYKHFEYLEGHILDAKPDYLMIVKPVLTNSRAADDLSIYYARIVYDYIKDIFFKRDAHKAWWNARYLPEERCFDELTPAQMQSRLETTENRDQHSLNPVTNTDLANAREFIRTALSSGIKVILLDIPPNMEVLDHYNVPRHVLDFHGIGYTPSYEELLPELHDRVLWWEYEDTGGKKHFCDFVHFNEPGRELMSQWILEKIRRL